MHTPIQAPQILTGRVEADLRALADLVESDRSRTTVSPAAHPARRPPIDPGGRGRVRPRRSPPPHHESRPKPKGVSTS